MTQDTQNKFAAILAAAQAKANIQPSFNEVPVKKVINVIPEIKAIQAEINKPVTVAPPIEKPASIVTEILPDYDFSDMQVNEAGQIEERAKINVIDYSEKAIVLTGETYPIRKDLKALGAIFSYNFKCGAGWMFSKKRFNEVKEQLQLV